ncbi:MAG: magnesium transporter [Candidatus Magasanikbacteria bacterium]|jgi:magnesium transporter|nr:magnesium transporter [Candidatus Magasanikbacteria bacterium]
MKKKFTYADDDYESISTLFRLRAPILFVGILLGIGITFLTSRFETVLSHTVEVAFFLPFIIYMAAAVGTQTEAIYSRDLKTGKAKFCNYLHKEFGLGLLFGMLFGLFSGGIAYVWFHNTSLALSVGLAAALAIGTAPIIALLITQLFQKLHKDPAAGSGPIATVVQDMTSILIYGIITSLILL